MYFCLRFYIINVLSLASSVKGARKHWCSQTTDLLVGRPTVVRAGWRFQKMRDVSTALASHQDKLPLPSASRALLPRDHRTIASQTLVAQRLHTRRVRSLTGTRTDPCPVQAGCLLYWRYTRANQLGQRLLLVVWLIFFGPLPQTGLHIRPNRACACNEKRAVRWSSKRRGRGCI